MSDLHSYSKVFALGHPQLEGLTDEPVLVQEKLDGSQFSFMLQGSAGDECTNETLLFRSKGAIIHGPEAAGMFKLGVDAVWSLAPRLTEGYLYRAEYISKPRHNVLCYARVPEHYLVVYDIEDMNVGPYHFLTPDKVKEECDRIGFESIPPEAYCMVSGMKDLEEHMKKPSMLGGAREGVVLKNYFRFTKDGKVMMGKYVSEAFKEVHGSAWKAGNPNKSDILEEMIKALKTEARYAKAAQHLRERGELTETVRDIGPLIREVQTDVIAEEADRIKEALWKWAKGRVERGVAGGVPQWWKDTLAKQQFEKETTMDDRACPSTVGGATDESPTTYAPLGYVEEERGVNFATGVRVPVASGPPACTTVGEGGC